MQSPILCLAVLLWGSYSVQIHCNILHIGVLRSSFTHWMDIVNEYATVNGTSHIQTIIINDTTLNTMDDIKSLLDIIKSKNIVALVGGYNQLMGVVTDHLRIPYLITSMVPTRTDHSPYHIQIIPDVNKYADSIRDLFEHFKWEESGILYDTEFGSEIAALMMEHRDAEHSLYDIRAYDVLQNSTANVVRWALKDLRKNHVSNFLIVCSAETSDIVLTQALYLNLLSRPNSWLVVNMGAGDIALEKFIDSRANMTLLRLMVDPQSPDCALHDSEISLTKAIYHDVFRIINDTKFDSTTKDKISRADIRRQVKTMDINGCTGNLNFSGSGERNETFLQILALDGLINGAVNTISLASDGDPPLYQIDYTPVRTKEIRTKEYDIVIIATPFYQGTSSINFEEFPADIKGVDYPFHTTVATFMEGSPNATNFGYSSLDDLPSTILTCNESVFFSSFSKQKPVTSEPMGKPVYRIFSNRVPTKDQLEHLVPEYTDLRMVDWKGYPDYPSSVDLPSFSLHKQMYHIGAIETAASAMEMSVVAAKNVALLAYYRKNGLYDKIDEVGVKIDEHDKTEL